MIFLIVLHGLRKKYLVMKWIIGLKLNVATTLDLDGVKGK